MEMRVMRTLNWMVLATLLLSLTAVAQNAADTQTTAQPASVQTPAPAQDPGQPATPPAAQTPTPVANAQPAAVQSGPQPTTMDQVVDRFVFREKGLIKMLQTR